MKVQRRGLRLREQIKQYISEYTARHGYPPSQREIAAAVGKSIVAVNYHVVRMVQSGEIATTNVGGRNLQRSYRVT